MWTPHKIRPGPAVSGEGEVPSSTFSHHSPPSQSFVPLPPHYSPYPHLPTLCPSPDSSLYSHSPLIHQPHPGQSFTSKSHSSKLGVQICRPPLHVQCSPTESRESTLASSIISPTTLSCRLLINSLSQWGPVPLQPVFPYPQAQALYWLVRPPLHLHV